MMKHLQMNQNLDRAQTLQTKGGPILDFSSHNTKMEKKTQLYTRREKHSWDTRICQKHEIWLASIAQACNYSFTQ